MNTNINVILIAERNTLQYNMLLANQYLLLVI